MRRTTSILVALALVTTSRALAGDVVWTELPPLPFAISNNAVASVEEGDGSVSIYSFMGIRTPTNAGTITPASFRLTIPGGSWESIAPAPTLGGRAKIGANAIAAGGDVYLIGGYTVGGGPEVTESRLFRYVPTLDDYVLVTLVPVEVDDTVTGVYQDRYIYQVSGWHGPVFNNVPNVQVYDTQSNSWSQATPIPGPLPGLFGHAGTIVGNRIIYMDGVRSISGFPISSRVFSGVIDPFGDGAMDSITWSELLAHPGAPTYRAAASQGGTVSGKVLLYGGTDNPYNFSGVGYNGVPSQPLDQLLAWNPVSGDWQELESVGNRPPTMDHRGMIRSGACWVVVGGMTAPTVSTNRVFKLSLYPGDFDCDADVDLSDFAEFVSCVANPNARLSAPYCGDGDLDGDGDVDFADFGRWQIRVTSSGP